MAIRTRKIVGNPDNLCDLSVTTEGLVLTVSRGAFKIAGKSYEFADDQIFEAAPDAVEATEVRGFIVENLTTGDAELLVDEALLGEDSYIPDGIVHKLLLPLFRFILPARVESLDLVEIQTKTITGRSKPATIAEPVVPASLSPEPEPVPEPAPLPPELPLPRESPKRGTGGLRFFGGAK